MRNLALEISIPLRGAVGSPGHSGALREAEAMAPPPAMRALDLEREGWRFMMRLGAVMMRKG